MILEISNEMKEGIGCSSIIFNQPGKYEVWELFRNDKEASKFLNKTGIDVIIIICVQMYDRFEPWLDTHFSTYGTFIWCRSLNHSQWLWTEDLKRASRRV